jgi:serine protease DegQ
LFPVTRLPLPLLAAVLLAAACSGEDGEAVRTVTTTETVSSAAVQGAGGSDSDFGRIPELVRSAGPTVVAVLVSAEQGTGEGSGVIWGEDGVIVTNNHVVEGAQEITVALATGQQVDAEVVATDPLTDLAVLRVDRDGLPTAEFADGLPQVGELAVAIGNPLSFENTVTAGIVSGLHRAVPSGGNTPALVDLLQTDAPISPGNSGGALVDADGRVIGINVAYIPPEARAVSIGFAIPSETVVDVVQQLLESGEVRHAFLGVGPAPLTPELADQFGIDAEEGIVVLNVVEGSGAAEAGIQAGDVLLSADGEPLRSVEDLFALLRERDPGDEIELELLRDGERQTVTATLTDRPED